MPGAAPFNHSHWPVEIAAPLRPLPSWGLAKNSAAEPPQSPACAASAAAASGAAATSKRGGAACGAVEVHRLVPHGGTDLRIGELPVAFYPKRPAATVEERA